MGRQVKANQPPKPPPVVDDGQLAEAIKKIAEATERLLRSGLNRRAIIVLVADDTKIAKRTIQDVLDSLAMLQKRYAR